MTVGSKNEGGGLSSEWVKRQLRSLSAVTPRRTLREKLVAAIPQTASKVPRAQRWSRVLGWMSAAAVVVIVASVVARLGGPSRSSQRPIIDGNNGAIPVVATDTNSICSLDMNACDNNSPY
jgi:hypothetical protein